MIPATIIDIETVRIGPWEPKPDARSDFAPPPGWRVVCIAVARLTEDGFAVTSRCDPEERPLVDRLLGGTGQQRGPLVTFNGRHFDLPVLVSSAMRHRISWPWYWSNKFGARHRYGTDDTIDLADQLNDHGAADKASLDTWLESCGLGAKLEKGGDVAAMWAAGEHERIARYCAGDVQGTAALYVRWLLTRGRIDHITEERLQGAIASCEPTIWTAKGAEAA